MKHSDDKINKRVFEFVQQEDKNLNVIIRPSETYWQDVWRRIKLNKVAMISFVLIVLLIVIAIVGPWFSNF